MNKLKELKENIVIKGIWAVLKAICIFLVVVLVTVIFIQRVSNNRVTFGGYGIYTVVSGSMSPDYKVWDMLIAEKVDPKDIYVGDNVVYEGEEESFAGKVVTHKVIKKRFDGKNYYYTTKGIANDLEDPEIGYDQIHGKVIYRSVILSFLSKLINNLYGFYFIIFLPFVLVLFFEIIDLINERANRKKE